MSLTITSGRSSLESCYHSFTIIFVYQSGFEAHPVFGSRWRCLGGSHSPVWGVCSHSRSQVSQQELELFSIFKYSRFLSYVAYEIWYPIWGPQVRKYQCENMESTKDRENVFPTNIYVILLKEKLMVAFQTQTQYILNTCSKPVRTWV